MHWADAFVGAPHVEMGRGPEGFDCLGLLIAVQRRVFGRTVPDPACSLAQGLRPAHRAALEASVSRVALDDAQEGDALLFFEAGRALHVGVAIDQSLMLHSHRVEACVEAWRGPRWFGKLEGVYRFA